MADEEQSLRLADVPLGALARVRKVGGLRRLRVRLMEMGLLPGSEIEVVRRAPLGDPVELRLRGYSLCVRREDALAVEVELVVSPSTVPARAVADPVAR